MLDSGHLMPMFKELVGRSIGCEVSSSTQLEGSILVDLCKGVRPFISHLNQRVEASVILGFGICGIIHNDDIF